MAFDINEFRSSISSRNGVLRNNKFEIIIPKAPIFGNKLTSTRDKLPGQLSFWCEYCQLPGIGLMTYEVKRHGIGPFQKMPFVAEFMDINASIIADGEGLNRKFISAWMDAIIHFNTVGDTMLDVTGNEKFNSAAYAFEVSYKTEYATEIKIIVYNDLKQKKHEITLHDAYPIYMGDVNLSWADNNTFMSFPVSFTFKNWHDNQFADLI